MYNFLLLLAIESINVSNELIDILSQNLLNKLDKLYYESIYNNFKKILLQNKLVMD